LKPSSPCRPAALLAAALLLSAAGCGLSEYESRIALEQKRMKDLDDEERHLAEPIEIPSITTKEGKVSAWPIDVFLRPPIKTYTRADDKKPDDLLYRYGNGLLMEGGVSVAVIDEKEKRYAGIKDPKKKVEAFHADVLRALKIPPQPALLKPTQLGSEKVFYYDDKGTQQRFYILFQEQIHEPQQPLGPGQPAANLDALALVYQIPFTKHTDQEVNKAIEYSLKSLRVGAYATRERKEYRPRKRKPVVLAPGQALVFCV
jgi:hypothetical protein